MDVFNADKMRMRQALYNRKWDAHRVSLQFDLVFGKDQYIYRMAGLYILEYYNTLSKETPLEGYHNAFMAYS